MPQVEIRSLIHENHRYECDRELFSFVNRSLNTIGMMAVDVIVGEHMVYFKVGEKLYAVA